jgi:hypothetical protein
VIIMDEKGFIFTADAVLGLVVVFILTASIVIYAMLPIFQGQDHQHLEALADSTLEVMEQTGTLRVATVEYSNNQSAQAVSDLQSSLNMLIPLGIGYKITVGNNPPVTDTRGIATSTDVVTKVKVISGPQEGWMGRSYYKIEQVNFTTVNQTTVTTVWNFHNYLSNFAPWNGGLNTYKYWGGSSGSSQTAKNITFYIPSTGPINGIMVLKGSASSASTPAAANTSLFLNGNLVETINPANFQYLYTGTTYAIYNNKTNLTPSLVNSGNNTFYLRFNSAASTNNMPWFSILANYTTTLNVPQGIVFDSPRFYDIAGVGRPTTSLVYNLDNGALTNVTGRSVTWSYLSTNDYDLSTPFSITGIPGKSGSGIGSAVGSVSYVYLPNNTRLFDAYTVVNAFGGVDGCVVQVKPEGGTWQTVFSSFDSAASQTDRSDGGYGFLPGVISLHDTYNNTRDYLRAGNNTVRIIIWDDVPGGDYDLVGLENCYTTIAYSQLPIRWDTTTFDSVQSSASTQTQSKSFSIDQGGQNAYLFMGVGLDTRNVAVTVRNSSGSSAQIYSGPSTYALNMSQYDTTSIFTTLVNGTRVLKTGNYTLNITVTPSAAYESGDYGGSGSTNPVSYSNVANPDIFTGTRIGILYPQFLSNAWSSAFASTPDAAKAASVIELVNKLASLNIIVSPNSTLIKSEALYSGDVPNSIPIRLELWKR